MTPELKIFGQAFYKKLVGGVGGEIPDINHCFGICSVGVGTLSLPTLQTFCEKFDQKLLKYLDITSCLKFFRYWSMILVGFSFNVDRQQVVEFRYH